MYVTLLRSSRQILNGLVRPTAGSSLSRDLENGAAERPDTTHRDTEHKPANHSSPNDAVVIRFCNFEFCTIVELFDIEKCIDIDLEGSLKVIRTASFNKSHEFQVVSICDLQRLVTQLVLRARTATGQRSFAVNGSATWNRLPPALRSPDLSDSAFKRAL